MDALQEGGGLPASKFLDGLGICAVQMEGHGSTCSERVAADVRGFVTPSAEPSLCSSLFQQLVDVVSSDGSGTGVEGMVDTVDGSVRGAPIRENVMHSSSQGFDWAVHGLSAVLGDALTFSAILLAGNDNGCGCGLVELVQGCRVGDDVLSLPESDIFHSKGNGVACATCSRWGVLTNSQQIVQCNVAQVSLGFPMGTGTMLSCLVPMGVEQVPQQCNWDSQLGQCWRVITFVASQHVL